MLTLHTPTPLSATPSLSPPPDEVTRITETEKDNSSLFDRNTENQKLTHEQIEELKRSGKVRGPLTSDAASAPAGAACPANNTRGGTMGQSMGITASPGRC